jgi:hypothetical protein
MNRTRTFLLLRVSEDPRKKSRAPGRQKYTESSHGHKKRKVGIGTRTQGVCGPEKSECKKQYGCAPHAGLEPVDNSLLSFFLARSDQ